MTNIDLEWRKSQINSDMTVQTAVALQNFWPVSDLVLYMEVVRVKDLGHICLQCERSLLELFLRHFLSALIIHLYVPYPAHCNWVHSSSKHNVLQKLHQR